MKTLPIAVVVSTYNRPAALRAVLQSLAEQRSPPSEVVVADDGSGEATRTVIAEANRRSLFPVRHVWQEDRGFRAAAVRNRGVAAATSDYVVLLDDDCIVLPDFLLTHAQLAERSFFVRGNRVSLSPVLTDMVCREEVPIHRWNRLRWLQSRMHGNLDRFLPLVRLPLGPLRKAARRSWAGVKTCNLGLWREDILAVNGFDEAYRGWGFEDYDLAVRLMKHGTYRKEGRFAIPVLHLWHEEGDRAEEAGNRERFNRQLDAGTSWAEQGVDQ